MRLKFLKILFEIIQFVYAVSIVLNVVVHVFLFPIVVMLCFFVFVMLYPFFVKFVVDGVTDVIILL